MTDEQRALRIKALTERLVELCIDDIDPAEPMAWSVAVSAAMATAITLGTFVAADRAALLALVTCTAEGLLDDLWGPA